MWLFFPNNIQGFKFVGVFQCLFLSLYSTATEHKEFEQISSKVWTLASGMKTYHRKYNNRKSKKLHTQS